MQDRHVDQVMNVIRQVLNISNMPEAADRLRAKLQALNLKRGPEPSGLGKKRSSIDVDSKGKDIRKELCSTIRGG